MSHGGVKWTYTEYYKDVIKNERFDPSFDLEGVKPSGRSQQKAQTLAQTPATNSGALPGMGPYFNLRRDLLETGGGATNYQPWELCSKLKKVPFVARNSNEDPNLGLHLLTRVCMPADSTPLSLERNVLEGLVRQSLSIMMSQV